MFRFSRWKPVFLAFCLASLPSFCYAQAKVSDSKRNDQTEYPLTLNTSNQLKFSVTSQDGKMTRIDNVGDPGSSWTNSGTGSSTANFTGTPNQGKSGTFKPTFSGEATITGSGPGPVKKYDWTAKAKYELGGRFQVEIVPDDQFIGNRTKLGVAETGEIKVFKREGSNDEVVFEKAESSSESLVLDHKTGPRFKAGNTKATVTLRVWAKVNGHSSEPETVSITIVEPQGVVIGPKLVYTNDLRVGSGLTNDYIENNPLAEKTAAHWGFGFHVPVFLTPKDVSFSNIRVWEGECMPSKAEGSQAAHANQKHPRWNNPAIPNSQLDAGVSSGNKETGCRVLGPNPGPPPYDAVGFVRSYDVKAGFFAYDIPWFYKTNDYTSKTPFAKVVQSLRVDGKKATVTKGGQVGEFDYYRAGVHCNFIVNE